MFKLFGNYTDNSRLQNCDSYVCYPNNDVMQAEYSRTLHEAVKNAHVILKERKTIKRVSVYGYKNGKKIFIQDMKNWQYRT